MSTLVSQKRDLRKILTKKRDIIKKNATVEFNYNVFKYLLEKKNDIYSWISKYNNYNVVKKTDENQDKNQEVDPVSNENSQITLNL